MARARNLKPGYFFNHDLAKVEPLGRIMFTGLWCIADREGRLKDRPERIRAETLPYDDCDPDDLLNQLAEHGFILRYVVNGEAYIQVINFLKHQNPHQNEKDSEIPAPECSGITPIQAPECSNTNPASSFVLDHESFVLDHVCPNPETSRKPPENITTEEREILSTLKTIPNYPLDYLKDIELLRQLSVEFPGIDIREEIKRFAVYKLDKPLSKKSNPRLQIRNWIEKAREFQKERSTKSGQHKNRSPTDSRQSEDDIRFIYD